MKFIKYWRIVSTTQFNDFLLVCVLNPSDISLLFEYNIVFYLHLNFIIRKRTGYNIRLVKNKWVVLRAKLIQTRIKLIIL